MTIVGGTETRVNTQSKNDQDAPQITALSTGGWVVTWFDAAVDESEVTFYQKVYGADGRQVGGETLIRAEDETYQILNPHVTALPNGGWVVGWDALLGYDYTSYSAFHQAYDADGKPFGQQSSLGANSDLPAHQKIIALSDGGWVVTWEYGYESDYSSGGGMQAYDADGRPVGKEILIADSRPEIIALSDGRWIATWSAESGSYQQVYDADGKPVGDKALISAGQEGVALQGGGWVMTWETYDQGTGAYRLHQQAYDSDGTPASPEMQINTHPGIKGSPQMQVTALASGGWVVTWASFGQDGSGEGIYQRAYKADGEPASREVRVNTYTKGDQSDVDVTALAGGGWVVTWTSAKQDGSGNGVYQQAYGADGKPAGQEIRVNIHTDGDQGQAKVTALPDGDWVVTWVSAKQDGSGDGVYQRIFSIKGETFKGTPGNDALVGSAKDDILYGYAGNDVLNGKKGADWMEGGKGSDTYVVDNAKDSTIEKAKEGADLVQASISYVLEANIENLTLTGAKAIDGTGNSLANTLIGNTGRNTLDAGKGNDTLEGGTGNDKLIGGAGADKLYGGSGADVFIFKSAGDSKIASAGQDTVFDFSRKDGDKIDLKAIDANTKADNDQGFAFISTEKFHKKAGELRYEKKAGDTFVSGDINGDGKADFSIRFDASISFVKADFLL